jgi:lipopolysaccharide export system permease protein
MRVSRTLFFYLSREVVLYSLIGLLAVGAIMVSHNFLRRIDELAAVGFAAQDALALLVCVFGMLIPYVVPVAFLFGLLVAFGRLSSDSEITALRACGVSLGQLLATPLLLGLAVSLLTAWLLIDVEPRAKRELRTVLGSIASRGALVEPGRFNDLSTAGDRLLLVQQRDDQQRLEGVTISDRSNPERPFMVFAEHGLFSFDAERSEIHLILENGSIHFEPKGADDARYQRIDFGRLDYALDASALLREDPSRATPQEMTLPRILEILRHFDAHGVPPEGVRTKKRAAYEVELHRRLALPAGPLLFALLAVPLGMRRTRGARSYGVLVCVGLVVSYYALLSLGDTLGSDRVIPAPLALWLPNLVFAGVAIPLLRRARYAEI